MRWPIRNQLTLPMLSIVVLSIMLASGVAAWWQVGQARQRQERALGRTVDTLIDSSFPPTEGVLKQISGLSDAEFVLLDSYGRVEASTLSLTDEEHDRLAALEIRESEGFTATSTLQLAGRSYLCERVPVTRWLSAGRSVSLAVLYPEDRWSSMIMQAALPVLAAGAVMAIVVMLVTTVLAQRIVRPIRQLGDRAAAIADGDFAPVAVGNRDDELRDLALSINGMVEKLSRYESEVRQNERMRTLGQLGAGMAHQLRNAAAGASMAIELHARKCDDGDDESIDVATRQLKLMESYLQRFLTLGRSRPTPHERVCLQEAVDDVASLVDPACRHAKIQLELEKPDTPIHIEGDGESLRQLLVNLVLNAVEAAERPSDAPDTDHARVIVRLEATDAVATLRVLDTGPGPAAETRDQLFDPFVTEKPDGTGLGLYVARQIAEAHHGTIAWQPHDGMTCFAVEFPLDE
jgi:signal transduction histidine kinase